MTEIEKLQDENLKLKRELKRVTSVPDGETIEVTTIVAMKDGVGIVELRWGNKVAQLAVNEARDHARHILEACEAAESDAFVAFFFREKIGLPVEQYGVLLQQFREYREERKRKDYLPR